MYTRKQRIMDECTHREYWGQYVTESIKEAVASAMTLDRLVASTDPHLNDIGLRRWDNLSWLTDTHVMREVLAERGDGWSWSTNTCILKEAARQLIEEHQTNN